MNIDILNTVAKICFTDTTVSILNACSIEMERY